VTAETGLTLQVSLDLSAAFDTIDYKFLINRFSDSCGISGYYYYLFSSLTTKGLVNVQPNPKMPIFGVVPSPCITLLLFPWPWL